MPHNYIEISYSQNNKRDVRDEKSKCSFSVDKKCGRGGIYFW